MHGKYRQCGEMQRLGTVGSEMNRCEKEKLIAAKKQHCTVGMRREAKEKHRYESHSLANIREAMEMHCIQKKEMLRKGKERKGIK